MQEVLWYTADRGNFIDMLNLGGRVTNNILIAVL